MPPPISPSPATPRIQPPNARSPVPAAAVNSSTRATTAAGNRPAAVQAPVNPCAPTPIARRKAEVFTDGYRENAQAIAAAVAENRDFLRAYQSTEKKDFPKDLIENALKQASTRPHARRKQQKLSGLAKLARSFNRKPLSPKMRRDQPRSQEREQRSLQLIEDLNAAGRAAATVLSGHQSQQSGDADLLAFIQLCQQLIEALSEDLGLVAQSSPGAPEDAPPPLDPSPSPPIRHGGHLSALSSRPNATPGQPAQVANLPSGAPQAPAPSAVAGPPANPPTNVSAQPPAGAPVNQSGGQKILNASVAAPKKVQDDRPSGVNPGDKGPISNSTSPTASLSAAPPKAPDAPPQGSGQNSPPASGLVAKQNASASAAPLSTVPGFGQHTPPPPPPAPPAQKPQAGVTSRQAGEGGGGGDLLEQIQQGVTLKKVEPKSDETAPKTEKAQGVTQVLVQALGLRRRDVSDLQRDEHGNDVIEGDDREWS